MNSTALAIRTLLLLGILSPLARPAQAAAVEAPRGGRMSWARLVSPDRNWNFHAGEDPILARYIKAETGLNLDATTYAANPENLDQLCNYPLIFTNNIYFVSSEKAQQNLAEYTRRGGFFWVDFCYNLAGNGRVPGDIDPFFEKTVAWLKKVLPGAELRQLPANHDMFRCFFEINVPFLFDPVHLPPGTKHNGMYGVYERGRMVGLVSLATILCGWYTSAREPERKKMGVNIFVYAMTRTAEPAAGAP